jgi:hypothetical protein
MSSVPESTAIRHLSMPNPWLLTLSILALTAAATTLLWIQFTRRGSMRSALVSLMLIAVGLAAAGVAVASSH